MARLPELPARRVLRALERAGFREARRRGSHRFLVHDDGRSLLFAVHERERIGPRLLTKILKDARISPDEFRQLLQAEAKRSSGPRLSTSAHNAVRSPPASPVSPGGRPQER